MPHNTWFSSDYHFGHFNMIKFSKMRRDMFLTADKIAEIDHVYATGGEFERLKAIQVPDQKSIINRHDELLIANHNACVKPGDDFFFLGDFSMAPKQRTVDILKRLNGNKYFIWGNHDKALKNVDAQKELVGIWDLYEIKRLDPKIILCHYPMRAWNQSHRGTWHLFGHEHGQLPDDPTKLTFDVGVDCWNFAPVSYEDIQIIMKKRIWNGAGPTAHHKLANNFKGTK